MKKLLMSSFMLLMVLCFAQAGSTSTINLFDYAFNVDGTITSNSFPSGIGHSLFDDIKGIGTIQMTISGVGSHFVGAFFDHEIDEAANTYYNEFGSVFGSAAAGQSWEIDEPGYAFGDIYDNFKDGALDNSNGVPDTDPEDVSMAMGWDFNLAADETAIIQWILGLTTPTSGFYLAQTDSDSQTTIYLSSSLNIRGGVIPPIPEPSTMILFGLGLLGLARAGRKR